jgi:TonB-dependent receptor
MHNSRLAKTVQVLALCLAVLPAGVAAQSATGTVSGRVKDQKSGEALPGASVVVLGTSLRTAVDRSGTFTLAAVPAGTQTIVVSYLGHTEDRRTVNVTAGANLTVDVELKRASLFTEQVTVVGDPIQEGQARALNQQRTALNIMNIVAADQIGRFPDANAAEAAQRIPGLSIERDQGEGRYVLVRGTEARLNSMLINGERIPSPESEIRSVALDVVPADLLQAIEVSKALTPDMDADAIGGVVNLITRQAPERPRAFFTFAGGHNSLMSDSAQGSLSGVIGRRFNEGRTGVLLAFSATNSNRGSDNFEVAYDDGDLEELQVRDYTINRKRYGVNGSLDFRTAGQTAYWIRGIWNRLSDQEFRRTAIFLVSDNEIERELKDRFESQTIASLSFGSRRLTARGWDVDFNVSSSYARENEPNAFYTVFGQEDVEFAPNVSPTSIDPNNIQANPQNENVSEFALNGFSVERNSTTDRDLVGAFNVRMPLRSATGFTSFFKTGFKLRDKRRSSGADTTEFETEETVPFSGMIDTGFNPGLFLDGRYQPGPHVNPSAGRALLGRPDLESEFDFETDGADYRARERITSFYAMAELYLGKRLMLLPGVRVEDTRLTYDGNEVLFDEDGEYVSTRPLTGKDNYAQVLPGFHVRYALSDDSNLRVAVTRTLARPNYYDLVPYQFVIEEDREVELGNPSLLPTTSWNFDVLAERYFRSVGIVSGGVFYKRLSDYIFQSTFEADRDGERFDFFQPQNGDSATLIGAEFAIQSYLRFLPGPLGNLGVYANYTFTDSSAQFPGRDAVATLPGQSRHLGNMAVWFEHRGFSARVSVNFHGRYISEVGGSEDEDQFYDNHRQVDLTLSQAINGRIRVFAEFLNLSNAPLRYFQGVVTRPIQEEYYRWWANFGARIGF